MYFKNRIGIRWRTWQRCGHKYRAEIDPLRLLWVNPREINRVLPLSSVEYAKEVHDVKGGDWDQNLPTLEKGSFRYRSLTAHFQRGVPWEDTELFAVVMGRINSGRPYWHNCKNIKDVERRCEKVDRLYELIRTHGYKSQTDLLRCNYSDPLPRRKRLPELGEIVVNIARDGEIIFVDGVHRLSIAKILGIEAVPVNVLVRHSRWQEYRDSVVRNIRQMPLSVFDHPDLAYFNRALYAQLPAWGSWAR